jgi:hypothetical protein
MGSGSEVARVGGENTEILAVKSQGKIDLGRNR